MRYDSVFISDIHLGTDRCNAKKFLKFLKQLNTKKLVMVGDILDIQCMEQYHTHWRKIHTQCIHQLIKLARSGVEIIHIFGNHEAELRRYSGFEHKNYQTFDQYVYKTRNGKRYLCIHGDKCSEYSSGSWKQLMFNWGYEFITPLNIWTRKLFNFSLINFLKTTKRGRDYIERYETDVVKYTALKGKYHGVICGHIHVGNIRQIGNLTYMCCGDFVDECSAIVEKNGEFNLLHY